MPHGRRSLARRTGRTLLVVLGAGGGLAAFDAVLLFVALVLKAAFGGLPNPYVGILLFLGLPLVAAIGGVVAWIAYLALRGGPVVDRAGQGVRV